MPTRTVQFKNINIVYEIERKNVKNVNLRVRSDGSVYVSANRFVSATQIDAFVLSKAFFILEAIARTKQREEKEFKTIHDQSVFIEVVEQLYPLFNPLGVSKPTLKIRDMKTRWGSCIVNKGVITLNRRLLAYPRECIEYVVLHEYCHFIHPNHSKTFYALIEHFMPDWKKRRAWLKD